MTDRPAGRADGPAVSALVIGYGNSLRSDDGVGWHAATRLADDPRLVDAAVLARHQLTPEIALDLSQAALAIFIDADVDAAPGVVSVRSVVRSPSRAGAASTHHVDAGALLTMAGELYGAAPPAFAVGVGVLSMDVGETLSPPVERAIPRVIDAVLEIVARHRQDGTTSA